MTRKSLFLLALLICTLFFGQKSDSIASKNNHYEFRYRQLYVPISLMIVGVATDGNGPHSLKTQVKNWHDEKMPNFHTTADDFLQFVPLLATYAFDLAGMQHRTDMANQTAIMVKSQIFTLGSVAVLKYALNETRPDGTKYSFPSGHTAEAFAGATLLSTEFGERYKWVPYAAYTLASGVGFLRIANNRHYISDVLFGAGLGILSTKVAYWTHQYKWGKKKKTTWIDPLETLIDDQKISNESNTIVFNPR